MACGCGGGFRHNKIHKEDLNPQSTSHPLRNVQLARRIKCKVDEYQDNELRLSVHVLIGPTLFLSTSYPFYFPFPLTAGRRFLFIRHRLLFLDISHSAFIFSKALIAPILPVIFIFITTFFTNDHT